VVTASRQRRCTTCFELLSSPRSRTVSCMVWSLLSIRPCKTGLISKPRRYKRLVFCDNSVHTISVVFSNADVSLFKTVLKNTYHILYPYLPENQHQHYHLRQRPHNKALIPKTTYLTDRDYIVSEQRFNVPLDTL